MVSFRCGPVSRSPSKEDDFLIVPAIEVGPGISLHCYVDDFLWPWSKAIPVFMCHGFSRNASFWNPWVPHAAEQRRVFRIELYGCGRSSVPPQDFRVGIDSLFDHLLKVLDRLGLDRIHWVGESSAGVLGAAFAARHPQRVASLVLCETSPRMRWVDDVKREAAVMRRDGVGEWCRRTLPFRLDVERASPELQAYYVAEMGKTPAHVAAAMFESFAEIGLEALLPKIEAPVLLLRGAKTTENDVKNLQTMLAKLPDARAHAVPDCGYGVYAIEPERCTRRAVEFWDEVESTRG